MRHVGELPRSDPHLDAHRLLAFAGTRGRRPVERHHTAPVVGVEEQRRTYPPVRQREHLLGLAHVPGACAPLLVLPLGLVQRVLAEDLGEQRPSRVADPQHEIRRLHRRHMPIDVRDLVPLGVNRGHVDEGRSGTLAQRREQGQLRERMRSLPERLPARRPLRVLGTAAVAPKVMVDAPPLVPECLEQLRGQLAAGDLPDVRAEQALALGVEAPAGQRGRRPLHHGLQRPQHVREHPSERGVAAHPIVVGVGREGGLDDGDEPWDRDLGRALHQHAAVDDDDHAGPLAAAVAQTHLAPHALGLRDDRRPGEVHPLAQRRVARLGPPALPGLFLLGLPHQRAGAVDDALAEHPPQRRSAAAGRRVDRAPVRVRVVVRDETARERDASMIVADLVGRQVLPGDGGPQPDLAQGLGQLVPLPALALAKPALDLDDQHPGDPGEHDAGVVDASQRLDLLTRSLRITALAVVCVVVFLVLVVLELVAHAGDLPADVAAQPEQRFIPGLFELGQHRVIGLIAHDVCLRDVALEGGAVGHRDEAARKPLQRVRRQLDPVREHDEPRHLAHRRVARDRPHVLALDLCQPPDLAEVHARRQPVAVEPDRPLGVATRGLQHARLGNLALEPRHEPHEQAGAKPLLDVHVRPGR